MSDQRLRKRQRSNDAASGEEGTGSRDAKGSGETADDWIERDDDWLAFKLPASPSMHADRRTEPPLATEHEKDASEQERPDENEDVYQDASEDEEPTCTICLLPYVDRAYLNDCLHSFCFACAARWLRHHPVCPLCKRVPKSIACLVGAAGSYSESADQTSTSSTLPLPPIERLVNRTLDELGPPPRLPGKWRDRRSVYRRRLRPESPPVRVKADRIAPHHLRRLRPFVERELHALLDAELVDTLVMDYVMSALTEPARTSEQANGVTSWTQLVTARLAVYLGEEDAAVFLREIMSFIRSGWEMNAYDRLVSYASEDVLESAGAFP
ncbi:hypothetical protein THASP1DRAFT_32562 [Thamnocephalis sphaerospora]|uniref:RING-type E3 ubiquitin transferase n=1 Tax=Thamnocephalis sphaerospora TaxID=78915 RepID=A0A4V1IVX7_9FUNG|nr:hypothetical protein THASP1DRAFT_32562 [Thamnocephalis sphaerospora]|eukprot:RKP05599.1 hypothetical protein THASP1DRAFT_32562 [Thamnocephalis sphaerospora]